MNYRTLINFDLMVNEKPFTFTVFPGTGLDEVDMAIEKFREHFKDLKEQAVEREKKSKQEDNTASASEPTLSEAEVINS